MPILENTHHIQALKYVRNTAGNTTKAHFLDDHDPVGPRLWDALDLTGLIRVVAGKVLLTSEGIEELKYHERREH